MQLAYVHVTAILLAAATWLLFIPATPPALYDAASLQATVAAGPFSSKMHGSHPFAGRNNSRNVGSLIAGTAYHYNSESGASV